MLKEFCATGILGIGASLPDKVVTNFDLEKTLDTSDEWIRRMTGISERRILRPDQPAYAMGLIAAQQALADAGIPASELGLIILATETPDYLMPSVACIIQDHLGAVNAAAFDLNAACSGFVYGLITAQQFIGSGYHRYILVIGCEGLSKTVDWQDRNTCILFGDGAGAVVLGPVEDGYGIITTHMGADGSLGGDLVLPGFFQSDAGEIAAVSGMKPVIRMNGGPILKFGIRATVSAVNRVINDANLTLEDIKYIIPHQANIRIIEGAAKNLGIPPEKMIANVSLFGNISSASIPVALEGMCQEGRLAKGDNIVIVGFGGGLTWASALLKWNR